jgi:hypothetical protein
VKACLHLQEIEVGIFLEMLVIYQPVAGDNRQKQKCHQFDSIFVFR